MKMFVFIKLESKYPLGLNSIVAIVGLTLFYTN